MGPQELHGGVNVVRRRGDTVQRPVSPATPAIHRLLLHVHTAGFTGAPKPISFDTHHETLTFLEGEVHHSLPPSLRTPELLASVATLLHSFHQASATFAPHPDDWWLLPTRAPAEIICHGDIAPYNCVVKDGIAIGFIDFDTAHPGPRVWDVAYAVYRFAPLHAPTNPDSFGTPVDQARRAAHFCRAYGCPADDHLLDTVTARLQDLIAFMHQQAAQGKAAFQRHIADGHANLYHADIAYLQQHRATLLDTFASTA